MGDVAGEQEERLVRQISGYLSVPFFLTDGNIGQNPVTSEAADAGAGFGIHGRFGWELGFIVLEGQIGWQLHGVSNTNSTWQDIWVGLGARFQLLNRSRMVPFVSAAFRLNIWSERVSTAGTSTVSEYDFDPGAQHSYSNSGYVLLARILELESGLPFGEFLKSEVTDPLGLADTEDGGVRGRVYDGLATGYDPGGATGVRLPDFVHPSTTVGAGSLVASARDLVRWNRRLGDLLSAAMAEAAAGGDVEALMTDAAERSEKILKRAGYY